MPDVVWSNVNCESLTMVRLKESVVPRTAPSEIRRVPVLLPPEPVSVSVPAPVFAKVPVPNIRPAQLSLAVPEAKVTRVSPPAPKVPEVARLAAEPSRTPAWIEPLVKVLAPVRVTVPAPAFVNVPPTLVRSEARVRFSPLLSIEYF